MSLYSPPLEAFLEELAPRLQRDEASWLKGRDPSRSPLWLPKRQPAQRSRLRSRLRSCVRVFCGQSSSVRLGARFRGERSATDTRWRRPAVDLADPNVARRRHADGGTSASASSSRKIAGFVCRPSIRSPHAAAPASRGAVGSFGMGPASQKSAHREAERSASPAAPWRRCTIASAAQVTSTSRGASEFNTPRR